MKLDQRSKEESKEVDITKPFDLRGAIKRFQGNEKLFYTML